MIKQQKYITWDTTGWKTEKTELRYGERTSEEIRRASAEGRLQDERNKTDTLTNIIVKYVKEVRRQAEREE